jgi:hypothetical protein
VPEPHRAFVASCARSGIDLDQAGHASLVAIASAEAVNTCRSEPEGVTDHAHRRQSHRRSCDDRGGVCRAPDTGHPRGAFRACSRMMLLHRRGHPDHGGESRASARWPPCHRKRRKEGTRKEDRRDRRRDWPSGSMTPTGLQRQCDEETSTAVLGSTLPVPAAHISPLRRCQMKRASTLYPCKHFGSLMPPKDGDCCVFFSYGSAPCPPIQTSGCCH